jgi:type II secretory pathway pseudopilin PulG
MQMSSSRHPHPFRAIALMLVFGLLTVFALSAKAASPTIWYPGVSPGYYSTPEAACATFAARDNSGGVAVLRDPGTLPTYRCNMDWGGYYSMPAQYRCSATVPPDTNQPFESQCAAAVDPNPPMTATSACAGYPTTAGLAAADNWVKEPRTYKYNVGANGIATVTGAIGTNGKTYTYGVDCYQKGRMADGDGLKLPQKTPTPAPEVKVDYPNCGKGNYAYTDETGLTSCSQNLPDRTLTDCTSGNGGYVNGAAVCLPANPAPGTAAAAAQTAQQKADAAVAAGRATTAALQAAADALTAYRTAANAAASMPSSTAAAGSAATAYASAQQAALAAGLTVPAPIPSPSSPSATGTGGNGTGSETSGPVECGSPGKPACKIDETGTPTPADMTNNMKAANDSVSKAWDDIKAELDKVPNDSDKKSILDWGFSFALPSSCSTYPMFLNVKIDFCQFQPIVHELMSLIWLGATMWICIGMVGSTLRGK